MKTKQIILVFLSLVFSFSCKKKTVDSASDLTKDFDPYFKPKCLPLSGARVVGGQFSSIVEIPYQVSLVFNDQGDGKFRHRCGGTIIDSEYILTAAHCFYRANVLAITPDLMRAQIGGDFALVNQAAWDTTDQPPRGLVEVKTITVHPDYGNDNDIALIKLAAPLTLRVCSGVEAARIATPQEKLKYNQFVGLTALASGWGAIAFGGSGSTQLKSIRLPILPLGTSEDIYQILVDRNRVNGRGLLAAGDFYQPSGDTCQGDSGGPLVVRKVNGENILIGVTSFGYSCALTMGFYTSVADYYDWINTTMGH